MNLAKLERARTARLASDYPEALTLVEEIVNESPGDIRPLVEAATLEFELGSLLKALLWLTRAEKISDRNFWVYYIRAQAHEKAGDRSLALDTLRRGLAACKDKVIEREYTNLFKYYLDLSAVCEGPSRDETKQLLRMAPFKGRPIENALHVSLVKDESDIILTSLEASYETGFRYYVVADNLSTDSTLSEISRFKEQHPDCLVYVVSDPVKAHYQSAKTLALAHLGSSVFRSLGREMEWIFPLDADEMLHMPENVDLLSFLSNPAVISAKSICYHICNFATSKPVEILPALTGANLLDFFPVTGTFHNKPTRKMAFRNIPGATIEEGNHFSSQCARDVEDVVVGAKYGIFLKHFPIRSMAQLRRKVTNGGYALSAITDLPNAANIGIHWRRDFAAYSSTGDLFLSERISRHIRTTQMGAPETD